MQISKEQKELHNKLFVLRDRVNVQLNSCFRKAVIGGRDGEAFQRHFTSPSVN